MLPDNLTNLHLPTVPAGTSWDELNLPPRTYRTMRSVLGHPADLNHLSVRQLLGIPEVHKQNLYDLLFAIQACCKWKPAPNQAEPVNQDGRYECSLLSLLELKAADVLDCLDKLRDKYLPAPPPGTAFSDARFSARARRMLRRAHSAGLIRCPADLGRLRLGQLLKLSGRLDHVRELVRTLEEMSTANRRLEELAVAARELEAAPYAESVHSDDVRFGSDVLSIAPNAANAKEAAACALATRGPAMSYRVVELKQRLEEAVSSSLEHELADIVSKIVPKERGRLIVLRLMGWDGRGTHSGRAVAREFGGSWQGIFGRRDRALRKVTGTRPFAPTLDRVLDAIEPFVPGPAEAAEAHLLSAGLTLNRFDLRGIQTAATVLGRTPPFACKRYGAKLILANAHAEGECARAPTS